MDRNRIVKQVNSWICLSTRIFNKSFVVKYDNKSLDVYAEVSSVYTPFCCYHCCYCGTGVIKQSSSIRIRTSRILARFSYIRFNYNWRKTQLSQPINPLWIRFAITFTLSALPMMYTFHSNSSVLLFFYFIIHLIPTRYFCIYLRLKLSFHFIFLIVKNTDGNLIRFLNDLIIVVILKA